MNLVDYEGKIEEARHLQDDGKFEEAIEILENLLEKDADSLKVKERLVSALHAFGVYLNDDYTCEYEKSITQFMRILKIDPNNYKALYDLGVAFYNIGKLEESLKAYEKSLKINPKHKYAYYNIGLIHETQEDLKKALMAYKNALKIDPTFRYALERKRYVNEILERKMQESVDEGANKVNIEKLKKVLEISRRIQIQLIQDLLNLDKIEIIDLMIEWGEKYQFEVDGDYIIINKVTLSNLLKDLDNLPSRKGY